MTGIWSGMIPLMTMQTLTRSVLFHEWHLVVPSMMAYAIRKERKMERRSRKNDDGKNWKKMARRRFL